MKSVSRTTMLTTTATVTAIVAIVAFLWIGPGVGAFQANTAPPLFDEEEIASLYKRVSPAVVEISALDGSGDSLVHRSGGSGFLIDIEGHIVTNNYVVEDAERVRVKFSDGHTVEATVLGKGPAYDLALLQVEPADVAGITPLALGDSSAVEPGQLAIAVGNPFGLEGSITAGIISGVNRDLTSELGRPISGVIQTDAPIYPGNFGGPLLNSRGEVVGVTTAIRLTGSGSLGSSIGFAVPVDTLKGLLPQLKDMRLVQPPWLGIEARGISTDLAERLDLPVSRGVYVTGIVPHSPADGASLIESGFGTAGRIAGGGDIITEVDGAAVASVAELVAQLNNYFPGDTVTLTVLRGGDEISLDVTLGEWPVGSDTLQHPVPRENPRPSIPPDPDPSHGFHHHFFPAEPDGD